MQHRKLCSAQVQSARQQQGHGDMAGRAASRTNSVRIATDLRQDIIQVETLFSTVRILSLAWQGEVNSLQIEGGRNRDSETEIQKGFHDTSGLAIPDTNSPTEQTLANLGNRM